MVASPTAGELFGREDADVDVCLEHVRRRLDRLASERLAAPLRHCDEVEYLNLCGIEVDLLARARLVCGEESETHLKSEPGRADANRLSRSCPFREESPEITGHKWR